MDYFNLFRFDYCFDKPIRVETSAVGSARAFCGEGGDVARGIVGSTCVRRNARHITTERLGCTPKCLNICVNIRSFCVSNVVNCDSGRRANNEAEGDLEHFSRAPKYATT